jgi:glutathione S-transferase
MAEFTLYIGNKAYSSWSLRGWLACKAAGIAFDEVVVPMNRPESPAAFAKVSPTRKVPTLDHNGQRIWESIAIAEYLAEIRPQAGLWPADRAARAHARTISAEMHAGFTDLRRNMWMNTRRKFPGKGRTPEALADIARIQEMWRDCRQRYGAGGPYLFGKFTLADCMYAPVVARFVTWEPEIDATTHAYVEAVWNHHFMLEWRRAADAEPWVIEKYETAGS